ncbi:MAG: hypothetical protein U9N30_11210 [Campylobacterota bacterium]|nr:hypothetical protein [Campylobacterota bacterium]
MGLITKFFLLLILITSVHANDGIDVLVSNKDIRYKSIVTLDDVFQRKVNKVKRHCIPVEKKDFKKLKLIAKRYISSGKVLCLKDLKTDDQGVVVFDFGTVQIEKRGKVIFENKKYIKIRNTNGKIEKIYKDGSQ